MTIQHYAIEYTINDKEGSQLEYVEKALWFEVAAKAHNEIVIEGDTIIIIDTEGVYYS